MNCRIPKKELPQVDCIFDDPSHMSGMRKAVGLGWPKAVVQRVVCLKARLGMGVNVRIVEGYRTDNGSFAARAPYSLL